MMQEKLAKRTLAVLGVKIAVTVLLGWLALRNVNLKQAVGFAETIPVGSFAAVVLISAAQLILATWRWRLVHGRTGVPLALVPALRLFLLSQFYAQTLPSTVPGDAARIWGAARFGGKGAAAVGVLIDRILTLLALLLLAGISVAALLLGGLASPVLVVPLMVLAAGFVALAILVIFRRQLHGFLPTRAGGFALQLGDALHQLTASPDLAGLGVISLLIHGLGILIIWVLAQGMHLPLGLGTAFIAMPLVLLAALIPISVNGWGVREGTMATVLAGFGIAHTEAVTLSVVYGLFQLAWGLAGGVIVLLVGNSAAASRVT